MKIQLLSACRIAIWGIFLLGLLPVETMADWGTYGHDSGRSCVTAEKVEMPLTEDWVFEPQFAPDHAWGDPQPIPVEGNLELPRLRFDDAFHAVAGDGLVCFGSSSDTKVYALDVSSGELKWEFFTEAPVRMAPTLVDGKLFVGSDDGMVYCLDAADGIPVWEFKAALGPDRVMGNGHLISLWPVRTGVVVSHGIAYFGAGIFPAEGLCLYALEADTGKPIWVNDTYGRGGRADISPQGYILLSKDRLFVPSGRSMPAVFDRSDGRFLYQRNQNWRGIGLFGGTYAVLGDDQLYTGTEQILAVSKSDGGLVFTEDARRLALDGDFVYMLTGSELVAVHDALWHDIGARRMPHKRRIRNTLRALGRSKRQRNQEEKTPAGVSKNLIARIRSMEQDLAAAREAEADLTGQLLNEDGWQTPCTAVDSMAVTANLIFAGGAGSIQAFRRDSGREAWSAPVRGRARGIVVSDQRAFVSTDRGMIHCFVQGEFGRKLVQGVPMTEGGLEQMAETESGRNAADFANETGVTHGIALVFGSGSVRAAAALARDTQLSVYLLCPDRDAAAKAREALDQTGLYGKRVVALNAETGMLRLPDYVANLIICDNAGISPGKRFPPEELMRVLKPCGGTALVRMADDSKIDWMDRFEHALDQLGEEDSVSVVTEGSEVKITRGALPGAGAWTHEYGTAGNTASSDERRLDSPFGVLWFGDPGPGEMVNRHASAASPLAMDGRFFAQGRDVVMAYDSYNGVKLWKRRIQGAMRTGLKNACSNLALNHDGLFVVANGVCLMLSPETGETLRRFTPPPGPGGTERQWGMYVAVKNDILWGSCGGNTVFALSVPDGQALWTVADETLDSSTLAVDGGKLFFVSSTVGDEQKQQALAEITPEQRVDRNGKNIPVDVRLVTALDARTGREMWQSAQYMSDCVKIGPAGGEITLMAAEGVVLVCGQPWNGHFWQEFFAGKFSRRSLIALSADDGHEIWSGRRGYRSRPLIVGSTVVAEPWAYDLHSGVPQKRIHPVTGADSNWQISRPGHHCGNMVGCSDALFFRSGVLGYYDLNGDSGTVHFGGQRPGCWINCLPANGLVIMPEASSGCVCAFPIHCTTVLHPTKRMQPWAMFSASGARFPVKTLRLNFGADGDRSDSSGGLWLAYPRPRSGRLVYGMEIETRFEQGGEWFSSGLTGRPVKGTSRPWVYASGARGITKCVVPLAGLADGDALYTLRFHFADTENSEPGERVFDIRAQGRNVGSGHVDVIREAGQSGRAYILEVGGVRVSEKLDLEFTPDVSSPKSTQMQLLQGLEIIREKVLEVGLWLPPSVELSDPEPQTPFEIMMSNHTPVGFKGKMIIESPEQFPVVPKEIPLSLEPGRQRKINAEIRVGTSGPPINGNLECRLMRENGTAETVRSAEITYLGQFGEMVIHPSRDTYIQAKQPEKSFDTSATLLVDGGDKALEDHHHAIVYLKFPLGSLPGRPIAAKLRLYVPVGGHTQSADSGVVRLVSEAWSQKSLTYRHTPKLGKELAILGRVEKGKWVERDLDVDLTGRDEVSVALVPTMCDGAVYVSSEGSEKPELVVSYTAR